MKQILVITFALIFSVNCYSQQVDTTGLKIFSDSVYTIDSYKNIEYETKPYTQHTRPISDFIVDTIETQVPVSDLKWVPMVTYEDTLHYVEVIYSVGKKVKVTQGLLIMESTDYKLAGYDNFKTEITDWYISSDEGYKLYFVDYKLTENHTLNTKGYNKRYKKVFKYRSLTTRVFQG